MTTYTIANGYDTWVWGAAAGNNFNGYATDAVGAAGGQPRATYLYFPLPADIIGNTIASATLIGRAASAVPANTTTVAAVTGSWSASNVTFSNQPTTGTTVATSVPVTTLGGQVALPVTSIVQAVSSGANWYGFQIVASSGYTFSSFESGLTSWSLTIVTTTAPEVPQSLVPNGTAVASGAPILTCDFTDNGGLSNDMAQMNVQVNTTNVWTSPAYDHTIATTVPVFDLSANGFTPIASGLSRFWRVRVQDTDGLWSGWSDGASFTYRPQPTLTVLTPAAGVLWDPTSDIIATTSANMSAYRVQVTDGTDRTNIRFDSGRLPANPSALTTVDVPLPQEYEGSRVLVDDSNYQLHIRIWDTTANRQSTPGSPAYVDSWSTFHFDDDLTQTPIATLTAVQPRAAFPPVQLTWTRASAPDGWIVLRDSKVIAKLDPADVISGVSTYTWTDVHPVPWVQHIYDVRATTLVSGVSKRSKSGPLFPITPDVLGIHLRTADGQHVVIDGGDTSQLVINDRRTSYKPLSLRYDVDVVTGFEGLSGQFTGGVIPSAVDNDTVQDAMAVMASIKDNPSSPVVMTYGLFSGRVLLKNVSVTGDQRGNKAVPIQTVSFGVNQVADF